MIRALFYRGRHHLRAPLLARPFDERPRVTVATITERIRRESARRWVMSLEGPPYAYGSALGQLGALSV